MAMDYAALAQQYGGTTEPAPSPTSAAGGTDYAALAKQFGGTSQQAPTAPAAPAPAPQQSLGSRIFNTLTGAGTAVANAVGAGPVADEYATKIAEIGQS